MLLGWADFAVRPLIGPGLYDVITRLSLGPKYDREDLHNAIREKLGKLKLRHTVTRIFVPAYDVKTWRQRLFHSCGRSRRPYATQSLAKICIATTAAPVYFPAYIFDGLSTEYHVIDGGVTTNNPTLDAIWIIIREMEKRGDNINLEFHADSNNPQEFKFQECLVLSLGTGYATQKYDAQECAEWGIQDWLYKDGHSPLLDIFSRESTMSVDWNTWFLFRDHHECLDKYCLDKYLRINLEEVRHTYILVSMWHPEA